jgi:ribonuclease P protein component
MMARNTFSKEERLCSKRSIEDLFANGSSFVLFPFRVVYRIERTALDSSVPIQVLFSVPKRRFKRAVTRNLLKRRMREAYRLHKAALYAQLTNLQPIPDQAESTDSIRSNSTNTPSKIQILLAIQYIANDIKDYALIQQKVSEVLIRLRSYYVSTYLGKGH